MKHGGDLLSYQHLYDGELLDFSSNINPFGYPKALDEAFRSGIHALTAYPDIRYRRLRRAISDYLACALNEVMVGNGSIDILDYFCRRGKRVIVCVPCFIEYSERAQVYQTPVVSVPLPDDFVISADLFAPMIAPNDVLMLGNPNNPTGRLIPQNELMRLQQIAEERGAMIVLDEAFVEFCDAGYDSIRLFRDKSNICVIRAATKFFGLPGVRLGYGWATPEIVRKFEQQALPWRINALADLAGQVIFRDTDYIERTKAYMRQERQFVFSELSQIPGMRVFPTDTNFLLIRLLTTTEQTIFDWCIRRGLVIRKASTFEGLDERFIRVAIKDHVSNLRLIQAFNDWACQHPAAAMPTK
ncbi:L-threonine-O-3-phosphate decarboxylase, putative [Candidatus Moduliflexus flocculans]|uniref:L-threonine-O-3-phosphate decarboxylase, putative n=1 Tax=Candidatus Moduliflexus flocculans TaxID=1499966 RepID=A0A081BSL7_9BACT|nr:L-threonine-O-3-phosphate decarboxylase, putative [Candidatus Moduliflexus flocculans]